jgi:hypothetical protein
MIGDATEHRSATGFVVVDVAFVADDDFITAPMVPLVTSKAASLPTLAAASFSRALTVGSSP